MKKDRFSSIPTIDYNIAVNIIKNAILRSQYKAAKLVNREMLSLYYGIGRFISSNSREGFWGTGAIKTISERLRKQLPGLKGFSETNLKYMRIFYEEWAPVLMNSTEATVKSSATADDIDATSLLPVESSALADDLELFLNLSFSHHIIILNSEKDVGKRWKYIRLAIENKWNKRFLMQQIKENVADHYGVMPSNFG